MRIVLLLLVVILLLPAALTACKQRGRSPSATPSNPFKSNEDLIERGLTGELIDEQQFALYFIARFELPAYKEQVLSLAAGDSSLAKVVAACIYEDSSSLISHLANDADGARYSELIGALYGLRCASKLPQQASSAMVSAAGRAADARSLWGLAVLDAEPGGPIEFAAPQREALRELKAEAQQNSDIFRLAALDALLGTDTGNAVDWAQYLARSAELELDETQWSALLRHADVEQWNSFLAKTPQGSGQEFALVRAAAASAPAGVELPRDAAIYRSSGMGTEAASLAFAAGRSESIDVARLDELTELFAVDEDNVTVKGTEEDFAELLRHARYAVVRNDKQSIALLAEEVPRLGEDQASGVLAVIERFSPGVLSDEQLTVLCDAKDRTIGYWMLFGWPDREVVRSNPIVRLVWLSPNAENTMLFQAYSAWAQQSGLLEGDAIL